MGLVINENVRKIQSQYINSIINFFMKKKFSYDYDNALNTALGIYEKMGQTLNNLANSISDRYSPYSNFHKGYPIITFKSSNSTWYFAYIRNINSGNVVVFDMKNSNQNQGEIFITEELKNTLDFMQRLLAIRI